MIRKRSKSFHLEAFKAEGRGNMSWQRGSTSWKHEPQSWKHQVKNQKVCHILNNKRHI